MSATVQCPACKWTWRDDNLHRVQREEARAAAHENRSRGQISAYMQIRETLYRAIRAGFEGVDPTANGRRSEQMQRLQYLRYKMYEMHPELKPMPKYSEFDPWGAHKPPRDVLVYLFGHSDEARRWGRKLFNEDFGTITVSQ